MVVEIRKCPSLVGNQPVRGTPFSVQTRHPGLNDVTGMLIRFTLTVALTPLVITSLSRVYPVITASAACRVVRSSLH